MHFVSGLTATEKTPICPSLPTEQPILEVERYRAKSHRCEPQEAIDIILRIGIDLSDCHVACPEITLA